MKTWTTFLRNPPQVIKMQGIYTVVFCKTLNKCGMNDKTREWVDEQVAAQPQRPRGRRRPRLLRGRPGPVRVHTAVPPGKCSTVPSLISICVSVLQFAATVEHSEKCRLANDSRPSRLSDSEIIIDFKIMVDQPLNVDRQPNLHGYHLLLDLLTW